MNLESHKWLEFIVLQRKPMMPFKITNCEEITRFKLYPNSYFIYKTS